MFKEIITALFSLLFILMFGGALYLILIRPPTLTESQMNLVMIALGVLFSGVNSVLAYYIGSSASSSKKDDTIQQAVLNAGTGNGTAETVSVTSEHPGKVTATGTTTKTPVSDSPKPTLVDKT